jgi:hypothetical protein
LAAASAGCAKMRRAGLLADVQRADVAAVGLHEVGGGAEIVSQHLLGIGRIPEPGGGLEDKAMDVLAGRLVHHRGPYSSKWSERGTWWRLSQVLQTRPGIWKSFHRASLAANLYQLCLTRRTRIATR